MSDKSEKSFNIVHERPNDFDKVIGNEMTVDSIKKLLKNKFPPLSIYYGKAGYGKTTVAKLVAKSRHCRMTINGLACNLCEDCLRFDKDIIYDKKTEIGNVRIFEMTEEGGKNQAREIQEYIRVKIAEGELKTILLEECQGMRSEAQGLLLPILEYIPENVSIIAMTTEIESLKDTFRSRSVPTFNFKSPTRNQMIYLLSNVCSKYGIEVASDKVLSVICEYSDDSPRLALNTLQLLSSISDKIDLGLVHNSLKIINEKIYLDYLQNLRGDMGLTLDFIEMLREKDILYIDFIFGLNKFLMKLITFKYRKMEFTPEMAELVRGFLESFDSGDLLRVQSIVADESAKILQEKMAKFQLVSMTFKLMNRDNSEILDNQIKTEEQVKKEQSQHLENVMRRTQETLKAKQNEAVTGPTSAGHLLQGINARVIVSPNAKIQDSPLTNNPIGDVKNVLGIQE